MTIHSNNVDCILAVGAASASSSDDLPEPAADSYTEVGMCGSIKLPVYERSVGRFNILNDAARRAVSGKLLDQDLSGDIVLDDDDPMHAQMFSDIETGNVYRNYRVTTPTGEIHYCQGFVSRWDREAYDASSDAKEVHVDWNVAVSGAPTVVAA